MQVQIEDVSPVEKKLSFEVPWDTVKTKLSDAYTELSKTVSLKGFRKGKVPKSVIQQMFGRQVRADVAGQLVRDSFVQAVQEHDLQVVSEPDVHDAAIKKGEPFTFHALIEVRAALELEKKDYEGLELTRRAISVGDDAVQHAVEQLQREHTDLESIEGRTETAAGDVLTVSLKGSIGDQEVDQPQYFVDLDNAEREGLPGLAEALTGIPLTTADKELSLEMPKGEGEEEARVAKLTISILDARHKNVPEVDDELAKDSGKAETLDELRKVLREELEKRAADSQQQQLREEVLKQLVKRNQIPVAEGLVHRAVHNQMERLQQMLGGSSEGLGDDLHDKLKDGAADDVRGEFLVEAVAKAEDIQVSDEDVDSQIADLAKYQGKAPNRMKAELERDGRLEDIQFSLRRDKTLDLLVERASVSDAPEEPPPEEEKPAKSGKK